MNLIIIGLIHSRGYVISILIHSKYRARNGGGLYVENLSGTQWTEISTTTISMNSALGFGGGLVRFTPSLSPPSPSFHPASSHPQLPLFMILHPDANRSSHLPPSISFRFSLRPSSSPPYSIQLMANNDNDLRLDGTIVSFNEAYQGAGIYFEGCENLFPSGGKSVYSRIFLLPPPPSSPALWLLSKFIPLCGL